MSVVIDCSIVLAWYFEDEVTDASEAVLDPVIPAGAVVPSLWHYEIANGLQMAVRRKRIDAGYREYALARLARLDIATDPESERHARSESVRLSDRHGLTVYDAAYLELARRRRLKLATLDKAIIRAGRAESVAVIGS